MGKILDKFMEKHELDDAQVLAMIGNAALQIVDPETAYAIDKKRDVPEHIKKDAKALVDACAFAVVEAWMFRFSGGEE